MHSTTLDGCDLSQPAPGRLLPPRMFFSPAVFDAEMTRIFARSWVHVADLPDVRAPGDYVAASIGTSPVVIVRGHDGVVRGFLNVCPHRGATIAEGRGNCGRQLKCPYHAWSFATDGRLVGAPSREEFTCDFSTIGLLPIQIATCGPMIFGCLDPAAQHVVAVRAQLALDVDVRDREHDMDLRPGRILYGGPDAIDVGAHRPSQRCDRGAGYFSGDPLDRQEIPW